MFLQKSALIFILLLLFINIDQSVKAQTNSNSAISIVGETAYIDRSGVFHIVGEVVNTSNETRRSIQIVASIYDSSHTIIGTASGYADIDVLGPGQGSGFAVTSYHLGNVPSIVYQLSISSEPAFGEEKPGFLSMTLGRTYTDSIGTYHVIGEVTNHGNDTANSIKVSGAFSNYDRQVIGNGIAYVEPSSLPPGQTAPFDMIVESRPGQPIVYGYYNVQSREYSAINTESQSSTTPSSNMQLKEPTANSTTRTQSTITATREPGAM